LNRLTDLEECNVYEHDREAVPNPARRYREGQEEWMEGWAPPNISTVIGQLPSMLIARAATVTIVTRETVLSNIISILAREVSGRTSVGLNAVAVQNARNR
jgi:hypothetical protein